MLIKFCAAYALQPGTTKIIDTCVIENPEGTIESVRKAFSEYLANNQPIYHQFDVILDFFEYDTRKNPKVDSFQKLVDKIRSDDHFVDRYCKYVFAENSTVELNFSSEKKLS